MFRIFALAALCLPALATAQETYWVANRASSDLHEISAYGAVLRRIDLSSNGFTLRSAHKAPNGKVWVVNFIQTNFTIVDPVTSTWVNVPNALGSPFAIAFDAAGNAWVSGGTGVVEYSPAGALLNSYPLPAAAPLGITIDNAGNKWIAHRTTAPGSISRIDAAGAITNFPLPMGNMQPTAIVAAWRGLLQPNHIWVIGDGAASQFFEFDENGVFLNMYVAPAGQYGSIDCDETGDIWLGSFSNGNVVQVDPLTGLARNTFNVAPNAIGLAFTNFGQLLITTRTATAPCFVYRLGRGTGLIETQAPVGSGTQSSVSTLHHWALVVNPLADSDNDGLANFAELTGGSSPFDAYSTAVSSLRTSGNTQIGSTASIDIDAGAATLNIVAFAFGTVPVGSGVTFPGFGGEVLLDLATVAPATLSRVGGGSLPLPIPNNTALQGLDVKLQAATIGSPNQFSNLSGVRIW
ncbi:MAG TPA: hypothetical protein VK348_01245 [Planctomycetota bacterium]|nr:hypothetical protein [Planctomycetota bacterium]